MSKISLIKSWNFGYNCGNEALWNSLDLNYCVKRVPGPMVISCFAKIWLLVFGKLKNSFIKSAVSMSKSTCDSTLFFKEEKSKRAFLTS